MDDQEASDSGRSQVVGRTGEERGASFRSQAASRRTAVQIPAHRGQSFRRIADSNPVIADSF
jgi:hypothetical protein